MSTKDWDEVKRLAADFQRAQLTVSAQRLTERNCIEIVSKLIDLKLLDVVYTTDGKEYVTPQKLNREILDELHVNGGRLSLVDVSNALNVSINNITTRVLDLVKSEKTLHFVLGHLVTTHYLDTLAHDLNEKLQQDGFLCLNDVSKMADLPGDFLNDQMNRRIGKIIKGKYDDADPSTLYTDAFKRRVTAKIRGILSGITKPTPVNQIFAKVDNVSDKLFFEIFIRLLVNRIDGVLSALSRGAYYIPTAHTRSQHGYLENFMKANGFIDMDAAASLGIQDSKASIKALFGNKVVFLKTCCLSQSLYNQVNTLMEEGLLHGYVDMAAILPFGATEKDIEILLTLLTNSKEHLVCGTTVICAHLVKCLHDTFMPMMESRAQEAIDSGTYVAYVSQLRAAEQKARMQELNTFEADSRSTRKDDRRKKAAGGKGGGGTQGRETKTKSTKKKYMAGKKNDSESDDDNSKPKGGTSSHSATKPKHIEFMPMKNIVELVKKDPALTEAPTEILQYIAARIHGPLTEEFQPFLVLAYEEHLRSKTNHLSREATQRNVKRRISLMKLYAEGLKQFDGDVVLQLEKYLLRTIGNDVVNSVSQLGISRLAENVPDFMHQCKSAAQLIQDLENFLQLEPDKLDDVLSDAKASLLAELTEARKSRDPALYLHIFVLLTFCLVNKALIQASGKFVTHIISSLQSKLDPLDFFKLKSAQEAVVANIKSKGASGDVNNIYEVLENMLHTWKF